LVRENNVDQALRILKRRMQREGIFREIRQRSFYEKPSEKRVREKAEAIRRSRKLARKQAQRDGLLPRSKTRAVDAKRGRSPRGAAAATAVSALPQKQD
jgi:small subunit ribosomal protein S21